MNTDFIIRNDDVLQVRYNITKHQGYDLDGRTTWECFQEADKVFEEYQYPCLLAVLTEGIDTQPEWVAHIKKNLHRYEIQMHGSKHHYYAEMSEEEGLKDLSEAKKKLEDTFGVNITKWYKPFGRKSCPEWADRVCEKLGITHDKELGKHGVKLWLKGYRHLGKPPFPHTNFHYWNRPQVKIVKEIIEICSQ